MPLPETHRHQRHYADDRHRHDEVRSEPIVALPLIEHHLQRPQAQRQQSQSDEINPETFAVPLLHVRRIADQQVREQQGNYADGNVDEENPAPIEIVGNPTAQRRTDRRRQHHRHAIHREGHSTFSEAQNVSARIACSLGCKPPPPTPCNTRKTISIERFGASPQRNELIVKSATQDI